MDLDEDVLRVAKELAREREQSLARVLSDLARRALTPSGEDAKTRNGVPILARQPGAKRVTSRHGGKLVSFDRILPWQGIQGGMASLVELPA